MITNPTEKQIENQILAYLGIKRIFAFKNQSTGIFDPSKGSFRKLSQYQIRGSADILGCVGGLFFACEVKKPSISKKTGQIIPRTQEELAKKASPEQVEFINKIKDLGGIAFFADSLDVVKEQLAIFGVN